MATFTAAAGTLTYGLIKANEDGWAAPASWGCLIASAVLFVVFVLVERAARRRCSTSRCCATARSSAC